MPPSRSYTPRRRPGARVAWPPDDSWSVADLLAEMTFWRSYSALREFSGDKARPVPAVPAIPAQRAVPHQERYERLVDSAYGMTRTGRRPGFVRNRPRT